MSITTRVRRGLATGLAAALASGGVVALAAAPAQAAERAVEGVQFRWGVNAETGSKPPFGYNYLSAGLLGNPGTGGQQLTEASSGASWSNGEDAGWASTDGNVTIEKKQTDGSFVETTWNNRHRTPTGTIVSGTTTSDHQVVIDEGTGTIDPAADDAEITWEGDFTVVFYNGFTYFGVSDPTLSVEDGQGTVTATLSGYGADQNDPTLWNEIPDTEVTLADLGEVDVTDEGFEVTPAYVGVEYDAPADKPEQAEQTEANAAYWGSFPQSFVDFQQLTGGSSYWYSSGGAADVKKPAAPLEVIVPAAPVVTPEVSVSETEISSEGTTDITVTGTGFQPSASPAPAFPQGLSTGGVYVALGRFAEVWKPSASTPAPPAAARTTLKQWWALPSSDHATLGQAASSAIALSPEGGFTATFTVDKAAFDEFAGNPNGNVGIYTYTRSANAPFETYTPITFVDPEPLEASIAVSNMNFTSQYGSARSATVKVTGAAGDPTPTGSVVARIGETTVGQGELVDGSVTFPVSRDIAVAKHDVVFSYNPTGDYESATFTRPLTIVKAQVVVNYKTRTAPSAAKNTPGTAVVSIEPRWGGSEAYGLVRTYFRKGDVIKYTDRQTTRHSNVYVPRLSKGTWTVYTKYFGNNSRHNPTPIEKKGTINVK